MKKKRLVFRAEIELFSTDVNNFDAEKSAG